MKSKLLLKSLFRMLFLMFSVSVVVFALVTLSPIDPVKTNVGQSALGSMGQEQIERLEEYWGVGKPPLERYFDWAAELLKGDWGISLLYRQEVSTVIWQKLSNSLVLMLSAWIISGVGGFFIGMLAGKKKDSVWDKTIKYYALLTASTPAFWIALLLLMIFAVWLKWLPIGLSVPIGVDASAVTLLNKLRHGILPAIALSITGMSAIILHTREKMIDVMESDYVLFARARGESEWQIFWRHGFRNILLPAITIQFASISEILGGSVLIEQVFSYPGLGQAAVAAGLGSDVPLLMGITLISAALVFIGNFIADILYTLIDPRIKKGGIH